MKKKSFEDADFDFENSRRITPEEQEMYRRAIEKKLGVLRPFRGRPPKQEEDKYLPIFIRVHPTVLKWAKKEAKKKKIGYQSLINEILLKAASK